MRNIFIGFLFVFLDFNLPWAPRKSGLSPISLVTYWSFKVLLNLKI